MKHLHGEHNFETCIISCYKNGAYFCREAINSIENIDRMYLTFHLFDLEHTNHRFYLCMYIGEINANLIKDSMTHIFDIDKICRLFPESNFEFSVIEITRPHPFSWEAYDKEEKFTVPRYLTHILCSIMSLEEYREYIEPDFSLADFMEQYE